MLALISMSILIPANMVLSILDIVLVSSCLVIVIIIIMLRATSDVNC